MRNRTFKMLGALAVLLLLTTGVRGQQAEWTVMVYLSADNDLEPAALYDLNEMELVGSSQDVNVVVQIDRHPEHDTSNGDWTTTRRYYVTGPDENEQIVTSSLIEDLGELNMGSPTVFADFVSWAMSEYPADKYFLILWDHGDGWRKDANAERGPIACKVDSDIPLRASEIIRQTGTEISLQPLTPWSTENDYKGIGYDETDGDFLTNREISDVLESFPQIDIIGFDACLMAMTEVAWELSDEAKYMVASEENEPGEGWPYHEFLDPLVGLPTMPPTSLCSLVIQAYAISMESYGKDFATLSAVDLQGFQWIKLEVDGFCSALMNFVNHQELVQLMFQVEEFGGIGTHYYDFYHLAEVAEAGSVNQEVKDAAASLMSEISNAVIYEWHGPIHSDAHGLSIYLPPTEYVYNYDYLYSSDFPNSTRWYEFLQFYWGMSDDTFEPNNSCTQTGSPVKPYREYVSYLPTAEDIDWWLVNSGIDEEITINLEVPGDADFDVYLYDSGDTTLVAYSIEYGNGVSESINHRSDTAQNFYLKVVPYESYSAESYSLSITQTGHDKGSFLLSFDDGHPDGGYYGDAAGDVMGITYNLPEYPMKVEKVWLYFSNIAGDGSGSEGLHHLLFIDNYGWIVDPDELGELQPASTGWNYMNLSDNDLKIYTRFFLGILYDGINTPAIAYDNTNRGMDFFYDGTNQEWQYLNEALFIRLDVSFTDVTTSVDNESDGKLPVAASLGQNYPNPFNQSTLIEYSIQRKSHVRIEVVNILGQVVNILQDGVKPPGIYHSLWDGTTNSGSEVASGVYFYRIAADDFTDTKKMVLLK